MTLSFAEKIHKKVPFKIVVFHLMRPLYDSLHLGPAMLEALWSKMGLYGTTVWRNWFLWKFLLHNLCQFEILTMFLDYQCIVTWSSFHSEGLGLHQKWWQVAGKRPPFCGPPAGKHLLWLPGRALAVGIGISSLNQKLSLFSQFSHICTSLCWISWDVQWCHEKNKWYLAGRNQLFPRRAFVRAIAKAGFRFWAHGEAGGWPRMANVPWFRGFQTNGKSDVLDSIFPFISYIIYVTMIICCFHLHLENKLETIMQTIVVTHFIFQ